jgi:hypothetical protein
MMFKQLTEEETAEYRKWARENYEPFGPIKGIWHPVVQQECVEINRGTGKSPQRPEALIDEATGGRGHPTTPHPKDLT